MADVFLGTSDMSALADAVSAFFAWGIGLGAVMWLVGYMVHVVIALARY